MNNEKCQSGNLLFAFDFDGTLLKDNKELTDNTYYCLQELMKRGVKFCIVTGRSFRSIQQFTVENLLHIPVVSDNGAFIRDSYTLKEY